MKRKFRLSDKEQFQRVRREGRSWSNRMTVLCAKRNDLGHNRYGFAVGRRIGKAVIRNRVKRLMREVVRLRRDTLESGWDLVFIARGPIRGATFQTVDDMVTQLLYRAALLVEHNDEDTSTGTD
ncbi:MAG: ribonuclease P protein component [Anaerolineae bacterium]